jgi:osmotically-inducible protein OsmY
MGAARRSPELPPQRPPARAGASLLARAVCLALAALVVIPPAFSGDGEAERRDADARQKLYVRRMFNEDTALGPYAGDIWVELRGTTAVLSGKVPSAVLRQRALFLAGQVKGIGLVEGDELQVIPSDGVPDLPSPFPEGTPPRGTLAGSARDGRTTQAPRRPDLAEPEPGAAPPSQPVTLLAPVPASESPSSQEPRPVVGFLPPRPLAEPPDLSSAVEALRRKEERFRRLKVEVRQKTVYLRGTVARWDDATDLAGAVRRLPGVGAVVLDGIQVDRSGAR